MPNLITGLPRSASAMTRPLAGNARLLVAITRVELSKKYAGSVLGPLWLVLQQTQPCINPNQKN